jgi:hypothetical protein
VRSFVIGAAREVDGAGSIAPVSAKWNELGEAGARQQELVIDPLEAGWSTPVEPNHFRSGCAPLEALARAVEIIKTNLADAVLIRGEDLLRSRYAGDKVKRAHLMAIYGEAVSIPEAYTQLAWAWMQQHRVTPEYFGELAQALLDNYMRTAQRDNNYQPPRAGAFEPATSLFRFVDCANPNVDFRGALIVTSPEWAPRGGVEVLGVGLAQTKSDGPAAIDTIAPYEHLSAACETAYAQSGVDFPARFRNGDALLEAYTCFPVVPLAFLLASGLVSSVEEIMPLLSEREVTVTGGMNLARAPWNNPALNALIVMCERLNAGTSTLGAVHGNGGLGYKQGFAILQNSSAF